MNKTYIKRQLTLNKLGYSIDKDLQKMIDYFHELIGDPNVLKKEHSKYLSYEGHMYSKDDTEILFYEEENEIFYVDYDNIWTKFEVKFGLNYQEINDLLTPILGETFNCKVTESLLEFINLPF